MKKEHDDACSDVRMKNVLAYPEVLSMSTLQFRSMSF